MVFSTTICLYRIFEIKCKQVTLWCFRVWLIMLTYGDLEATATTVWQEISGPQSNKVLKLLIKQVISGFGNDHVMEAREIKVLWATDKQKATLCSVDVGSVMLAIYLGDSSLVRLWRIPGHQMVASGKDMFIKQAILVPDMPYSLAQSKTETLRGTREAKWEHILTFWDLYLSLEIPSNKWSWYIFRK